MSQISMIPPSIENSLPAIVRSELSNLSAQDQEVFLEEYRRKAKSTGLGFLLWFCGLHYAYVKKAGLCIIFLLTVGGCFIWWFIDLFRVSGIIREYNKDVAVEALRSVKLIRR